MFGNGNPRKSCASKIWTYTVIITVSISGLCEDFRVANKFGSYIYNMITCKQLYSCKGQEARMCYNWNPPRVNPGSAPVLGRCPHSFLDVVRPDLSKTVPQHQESQKHSHDDHAKVRSFEVGDSVFVLNFSPQHPQPKWLFGQIREILGPVSYTVELHDQRVVHRHVDHIRLRTSTEPSTSLISESDIADDSFDDFSIPLSRQLSPTSAPPLRRFTRTCRQPDWWVPV